MINAVPAISPYLKARLYGWLLLSDAYGIGVTDMCIGNIYYL